MAFAYSIAFVLFIVGRHSRNIYYKLLPKHASGPNSLQRIQDAERGIGADGKVKPGFIAGKTHKPMYMSQSLKSGTDSWTYKLLGHKTFKMFYGMSGNKIEW